MPRHNSQYRAYSLASMIPDVPETRMWNLDQVSLEHVAVSAASRATREIAKMTLEKKFGATSVPVHIS